MGEVGSAVALVVNGEQIALEEVLSGAKFNGRMQFLEDAVDAAIVRQEAAQQGIEVTAEELQDAADRFRAERSLHSAAATGAWLEQRHLALEEWQQSLAQVVLAAKLRRALVEERVEAHFAQHCLSYEWVELSQLVVKEESVARELRLQIAEEEADFHALARRYSEDEATRKLGGYCGTIRRGTLPGAEQAAVFGAAPGSVVGPFPFREGWRLYRVESHHPAVLDDETRRQVADELFREWLAERRRRSEVEMPLLESAA